MSQFPEEEKENRSHFSSLDYDHGDNPPEGQEEGKEPDNPCARAKVQARFCVHHENTTPQKALHHDLRVAPLRVRALMEGGERPLPLAVEPMQLQTRLEGGEKPVHLAVDQVRLCWCREEPLRVKMEPVEFAPLKIEQWPQCRVAFDQKILPVMPVEIKEVPVLRHELTQEFCIPSRYKIAINLFGSEIGAIRISGQTTVIPQERIHTCPEDPEEPIKQIDDLPRVKIPIKVKPKG